MVKTMILGNSTTNAAIMPSVLDSAFSMANSSQQLEYDYFILTKYSKYCPQLRTVILPIDYGNLFALNYEEENGFLGYRAIFYKIYMNYSKHSDFSKWNFELSNPVSLRNKIVSFFTSSFHNDYGYDKLGRTTEGVGYISNPSDIDDLAVEYYLKNHLNHCKNYKNNALYVKLIADYCQNNNLRLLLLTCPKWKELVRKLDKRLLAMIMNLGEELSNKNDFFLYKCFLQDDFFTGNPSFFRDVTHMSDSGAYYFTNRIKCELKSF